MKFESEMDYLVCDIGSHRQQKEHLMQLFEIY